LPNSGEDGETEERREGRRERGWEAESWEARRLGGWEAGRLGEERQGGREETAGRRSIFSRPSDGYY
jgi:hypothetical protein